MQAIVKHAIYLFLVIFGLTATITISAIGIIWFSKFKGLDVPKIPYLGEMIAGFIIEVGLVVVLIVRRGVKYLPDIRVDKNENQTLGFMKDFIASGSSVTIVSNRVAWLGKEEKLRKAIVQMAKSGTMLEIITTDRVSNELRRELEDAGVVFFITKDKVPPKARFTLINGSRGGAEKLAIARGIHPDHEITIFDNNSGPQIIAMAKDIIRKSKELSHAA